MGLAPASGPDFGAPQRLTVELGDGPDALTLGRLDASTVRVVFGGPGDDRLEAVGRIDRLVGGSGDDQLLGGAGDGVFVGDGTDASGGLAAAPGHDVIDGGPGRDTVDYGERQAPVHIDLTSGIGGQPAGEDVLRGIERVRAGSGDDRLVGGPEDDELFGNAGDDRLEGRGGDDWLDGDDGDDDVSGGTGADFIYASAGEDRLVGGPGDDVLTPRVVDVECGAGVDTIDIGRLRRRQTRAVPTSCERLDNLELTRQRITSSAVVFQLTHRAGVAELGGVGESLSSSIVMREGWSGHGAVIAALRGRAVFTRGSRLRIPLNRRGRQFLVRKAARVTMHLSWTTEPCDDEGCYIDRFASPGIPITLHPGWRRDSRCVAPDPGDAEDHMRRRLRRTTTIWPRNPRRAQSEADVVARGALLGERGQGLAVR